MAVSTPERGSAKSSLAAPVMEIEYSSDDAKSRFFDRAARAPLELLTRAEEEPRDS